MMRQLTLLIATCLISAYSFAQMPASNLGSALGSVWKAEQAMRAKQVPNEFPVVYGGADISSRPTLTKHTAIA